MTYKLMIICGYLDTISLSSCCLIFNSVSSLADATFEDYTPLMRSSKLRTTKKQKKLKIEHVIVVNKKRTKKEEDCMLSDSSTIVS